MKILFLSPRLPFPTDTGGKIRTFNILKQIAKNNQVHLLGFSFEKEDLNFIGEFEKLGVKVSLIPIDEPSTIQKMTGVLFNPTPFSIAKYNTLAMRLSVTEILQSQSFDAVHVDHLHMASYIDCFKNLPCMLDEHNVEYKILERCANVEKNFFKKLLYRQQAAKMKKFESSAARKFEHIFACSIDDQQLLNDLTGATVPVHVIANGVDTDFFKTNQVASEEALVFTGSMDWLPNDDAVTYFVLEILPLIWQKKPAMKFYVVGKNPSSLVKDLANKDKRVIVTGRVDDVRPYIERSRVFIVPLRIGGGTRLKILEAMAMNKAVISTTIGAEGIECIDGSNILLGDSPQTFADKTISMLEDLPKAQLLGHSARELVCGKYDWHIIGQKLQSIYKKAVHVK